MTTLRLVGANKTLRLSEKYDISLRFRLWHALVQAHNEFLRANTGPLGRDSFAAYADNAISSYLDSDGEVFDPTTSDGSFDLTTISAKTIYNLLRKNPSQLVRVHDSTFRYVEAFLAISNSWQDLELVRPTFLQTLGKATAVQYRPTQDSSDADIIPALGARCMFEFEHSTSMVPAPLQAAFVAIWLEPVNAGEFLLAPAIPFPNDLSLTPARLSNFDKNDWSEDHYSGVAVRTFDGLSCHLTSMNARIPLYFLIKMSDDKKLLGAFVSYETPGYLLEYSEIKQSKNNKLVDYFENMPWLV